MKKSTLLNQVVLSADGSISVQWLKVTTDDDGEVVASEPHRTVIDFDGDIEGTLKQVSNDLQQRKFPVVPKAQANLIMQLDAVARANPDIEKVRAVKIRDRKAQVDRETAAEENAKASQKA